MSAAPTTFCTGCSYDLAGIAAPGVCPECGQAFVEHAGDERIALAWPCLKCGYSLLGLCRHDRCSECGMPAARSLTPTHFRFQPAAYRARVRRGAWLAACGALAMIVLPFVSGIAAGMFGLLGAGDWVVSTMMLAGIVISYILYALGWWLLLSPAPGSLALTRGQRRLRRCARVALVGAVVATVGGGVLPSFFAAVGVAGWDAVVLPLQCACMLVYGVFFFSSLLCLRPLLARASSARRRPGAMAMVAISAGVFAILCCVLGFAVVWQSEPIGIACFTAAAVTALITYIAHVGALESVRVSLKRVEREITLAHRHGVQAGETPQAPVPNTVEA